MPTYEYTCRECGENLEAVQSFSDAPLTVCPKCGGELRKVFRSVGIVFKGSGFYKTDSRTADASAKSAATATEPKPGENQSAETKSAESKSGETKSGETKSKEPTPNQEKTGVSAPATPAPATAPTS